MSDRDRQAVLGSIKGFEKSRLKHTVTKVKQFKPTAQGSAAKKTGPGHLLTRNVLQVQYSVDTVCKVTEAWCACLWLTTCFCSSSIFLSIGLGEMF